MTRRPHSHADEFTRRRAPIDETPLFRAPQLTEAQFLAKWLRYAASHARQRGELADVPLETIAALKRLGVALEPPVGRLPNVLTPDQAERYADALDGGTH